MTVLKILDKILRIIGAVILPAYVSVFGIILIMSQEPPFWYFPAFYLLTMFIFLATLSNLFLSTATDFIALPDIFSHIIIRIPSYAIILWTALGQVPALNLLVASWCILIIVCLPTIIAFRRNHPWKGFIMIVSLLGLVFFTIGWWVGLAWSFISKPIRRVQRN